MIHTISNKISEHLIENGLPKEKQEIYTYGCESFLNLFLCNFILITYAIIIGKLYDFLFWVTCFLLLRTFIGGLHMPTHFTCIISSCILGSVCISHSYLWDNYYYLGMLLLIPTFIFIYIFAPISHPNHPLSITQKKRTHTLGCFIYMLLYALTYIIYYFSPTFSYDCLTGIYTAVILCMIGKVIQRKEYL